MADDSLLQQAREEAEAIISEAQQQAARLLAAAEERRAQIDAGSAEIRSTGEDLATNLQRSIELLTQVLQELRRQLS